MPAPDVTKLLAALARAFARHKLKWYVFGAQAVAAAGVPRLTADIDVTVDCLDTAVLLQALSAAGFQIRDVGDVDSFLSQTRVLPATHRTTGYELDVVLAGPGLEEEMLNRVILRKIGRTQIPFIDTNDLVVLKILAGRPKDIEDVAALVRLQGNELILEIVRRRLHELESLLDDSTLLKQLNQICARSEAKISPKKPQSRKNIRSRRAWNRR